MREFDIADWYWFIGTDTDNVWSSLKAVSVPVSDAGYVAFLDGGNVAGPIEFADLQLMFAEHYPPGMLDTYARYKRWLKEQAGLTRHPAWPIKTDDRAQAKITGVYSAAQINPAVITPWDAADGTVHQLTAAQMDAMNIELLVAHQPLLRDFGGRAGADRGGHHHHARADRHRVRCANHAGAQGLAEGELR